MKRLSIILFFIFMLNIDVHADTTTGLVGWWKFEEGSGSSTIDSSGKGNTGTLASSPTWSTNCIRGNCLSFSGSNYVTMGNVLNLTSQITVSAWVNASSWAGTWPMIVSKGVNSDYLLMQNDDNAGTKIGFRIGGAGPTNTADGATDLNANQWYLVTGTYDGLTINLYINGILDGTRARVGTIPTTGSSLQVGGNGGLNFSGQIEDVRIYNRVLTTQEIYTLYLGDNRVRSGTLRSYQSKN